VDAVFVLSMPRSGSSFLGQLLDADPSVAVRLSPFFSYNFRQKSRNIINDNDFDSWISDLINTDDEFVTQSDKSVNGLYPKQVSKFNVNTLIIKDTRNFIDYVELFFKFNNTKIIFLDRVIREQISSWVHSPEFKDLPVTSLNLLLANDRKLLEDFPECEYWGLQDALFFKRLSVDLKNKYSNRISTISYATLAKGDLNDLYSLLPNIRKDLVKQRFNDLRSCNNIVSKNDCYGVYRPVGYRPKTFEAKDLPLSILDDILSL